jgi:glycine/betaine/sarcosine/D-proline reductase family selenoprotein B
VISKELDRVGIPVAVITAMYPVAEQVQASRIVKGVRIPYPCGDPSLPPETDTRLRRSIIEMALKALQTEVAQPTIFSPTLSSGTEERSVEHAS